MARAKKYRRTCPECGVAFLGGPDARFCTTTHKDAWHNRAGKRGKVAMPLVQAWAQARGRRGDKELRAWAFRELEKLADYYNAQDRAAGRMSAVDYLRPKMRAGWRAVEVMAADDLRQRQAKAPKAA